MNENIRHEPVIANFCGYDFVSIRVDGIDHFPISQLPFDSTGNQGFPVSPNNIQKDFKRLLESNFQSFRFATTLNPKKVDCISEEIFALSVKNFARKKDSEFAWQLLEASFAVQLRLANDVARGQAEEAAYYVELAAMRAAGIKYRRLFTDLVKMQKELGFDLNYGYMTLLVYRSVDLIEKYNAWKVVYTTNAEKKNVSFSRYIERARVEKIGRF